MASHQKDWTASASKWVVVLILGGSSVGGIVWTIRTRPPRVPIEVEPVARPSGLTASREPARPGPSPVEAGPASTIPADSASSNSRPDATTARLININTASAAELELLPRIGLTLAARIVADRSANGRFDSLDDLDRVRGIGPKTIEKFRDLAVAK